MRQLLLTTAVLLALTACGSDDAADTAAQDAATPGADVSATADGVAGASRGPDGANTPEPAQAGVLSRTFTMNRQTLQVDVQSNVARSTITITPKGLTLSNKDVRRDVHGLVTGVEMADLDSDGNPEVYVFITSADGKRIGSLFAVASSEGKRLSEVTVPSLADDARNSAGYRGGDEFAIVEKVLARRFPLFDDSGEATGTLRQLQYTLVGGATPQLKLDRAAEF